MPKDENHRSQADRHPQDGGEIAYDSLESAISFIGRNAGATGEEPFERRQRRAGGELEALLEWASALSFFLDQCEWEEKAVIGGSEHDIWEFEGLMWKVTRPNHFGWTVLAGDGGMPVVMEATPLEYLIRWKISNRILGDEVRLRGVHSDETGTRVIISQPFIAGPYPDSLQVMELMRSLGFQLVPSFSVGAQPDSSYLNPDLGVALFDATTDNFIFSEGMAIPVDVIPVKVGPKLRSQLLELMA